MRGKANLLSFGAIHLDMQFWLVEGLLNTQVHDSRNKFELIQQVVGELPVGLKIAAHNLHVNGGRQSKIQNLADDIGGQEIKSHAGKFFVELQANVMLVVRSRMMVFGESHQNVGVARTYRRGVAVREVDAAVRQANVVDNRAKLRLRNLFAGGVFHVIAKRRGLFEARSGGSAQVQFEFAGINRGEKILAQQRQQRKRQHADSQKANREKFVVADTYFQHSVIALPELLKTVLEFLLHPREDVGLLLRFVLGFHCFVREQVASHGR